MDEDAQDPPTSPRFGAWMGSPAYNGPPVPFGDPPPEPVKLVGEIPWELRDDAGVDVHPDADKPIESGT